MKCLLVDDEPGIREGLAALLRRQGHHVDTAADCAAAARALAASVFDVVISDWRLPDGIASTFVVGCTCPVIAVSGHPDEVPCAPPIHEVLGKPVSPATLARAIAAAVAAGPAAAPPLSEPLPRDAQEAIDAFTAQLPATTAVRLDDDGTFVIARADVTLAELPAVQASDGDLRVIRRGARCTYELRVCRDGRPATDVPVVRAGTPWPAATEVAVDFHDTTIAPGAFLVSLDHARAAAAAGRVVHFLNVPERLRCFATSQGRAHDMPMREPVGPRMQADFADLWSLP